MKPIIVTVILLSLQLAAQRTMAQDATSLAELLEISTGIKEFGQKSSINRQIGLAYQKQGAFQKANEYFEQSLLLEEKLDNPKEQYHLLMRLGDNYLHLGELEAAETNFTKAQALGNSFPDAQYAFNANNRLANLYYLKGAYEPAIRHFEKVNAYYESQKDFAGQVATLNNIGVIYKKMGRVPSAKNYFDQSLRVLDDQIKGAAGAEKDPVLLTNLATTQANLGEYDKTIATLDEAFGIYQRKEDARGMAQTLNYKGATHFINGNNTLALQDIDKAIQLGEETGNKETLKESYKILSEIYASEDDFQASQSAFKRHLNLKDQLELAQEDERQVLVDRQIAAERNENNIKQALAQKREQELALERAKLEGEAREKELQLLKQQQELQAANLKAEQLEKQRVAQALLLARQQLEQQQRDQEIATLQREAELKNLELARKKLEEQEQMKAYQLLETERELQEQKLQEEQTTKKYFIGAIVFFGIFLLFILYSLYQRSKANRLLQKQQQEIKDKNEELQASEEELRQNNEELMATQEVLAQQKETLQVQYLKMTQSINYAETIQKAILPTVAQRKSVIPDHFLLFKPKDIVSGDFYWVEQVDAAKSIALVDCTGHGVPGAFMSMIGNNLLTEIILQNKEKDPAKTLGLMHKGIRQKLSQEEGANNDGMDMSVCTIEKAADDTYQLSFAGAKSRMFVMENGELAVYDGDRKSIGGRHYADDLNFERIDLKLNAGAQIYLTTDGFLDQADPNRRGFSLRRFKEVILANAHLPMKAQGQAFEKALLNHQQNAEQRDDISVLGIKL